MIYTFGHKNGIPQGFDLYFDLRDIKSTAWQIDGYHQHTGQLPVIRDLLFADADTRNIYNTMKADVLKQRKRRLQISKTSVSTQHVAIGCRSGRHRSVAFACQLAKDLAEKIEGEDSCLNCILKHLDLENNTAKTEKRGGGWHCTICAKHSASTACDMNKHLMGKKHAKRISKLAKQTQKPSQKMQKIQMQKTELH